MDRGESGDTPHLPAFTLSREILVKNPRYWRIFDHLHETMSTPVMMTVKSRVVVIVSSAN